MYKNPSSQGRKTLSCIETEGDYIPARSGTAIIYENSLILWGGDPFDNAKCCPKIIQLDLSKFLLKKSLEK